MKLLCILLLLGAPPAWAGKKSELAAETRRLVEESEKLAARNAWTGVERSYVQLLALERKGAELPLEAHVLAAHAAQHRGDPLATWERLNEALEVQMDMEALTWKADLEATYSRFEIEVAPGYQGSLDVTSLEPLFDPVHQKILASLSERLKEQRYAEVLLPLGRYAIGGTEAAGATVILESYGGETQRVMLRTRGATVADPTVVELTPTVTPTQADAPTAAAPARVSVTVGADVEPEAWTAAGPRVQRMVTGVDGVAEATLVPAPSTWYFVAFDAGSLRSVGTSPEAMVAGLRQAFRLTDAQLSVTPNQIGIDGGAAKSLDEVGSVEVSLGEEVVVPIQALSRLRTGPRPGAPAAGIQLLLDPGADADAVTQAVAAAVSSADYANLDLRVVADASPR